MEQATFFHLAVSTEIQKESFIRMNRKETEKKKMMLAFRKGQKKGIPIPIFQTEKCWIMIMTALHLYSQSLLAISTLC